MQFSLSCLIFSALLIPTFAMADQIVDYGVKLSADQMIQQGFKSKISDDFQVLEKRDDVSRVKVMAQKNDFVAYLDSRDGKNKLGFTKLNSAGKVTSQTKCLMNLTSKKYVCTTQTTNLCHSLFKKMDSGAFNKLKECSSIIQSLPYDSNEITTAQNAAFKSFSSGFALVETSFSGKVDENLDTLAELLENYASCSALKDNLAAPTSSVGKDSSAALAPVLTKPGAK